jgi:hypothetical protein
MGGRDGGTEAGFSRPQSLARPPGLVDRTLPSARRLSEERGRLRQRLGGTLPSTSAAWSSRGGDCVSEVVGKVAVRHSGWNSRGWSLRQASWGDVVVHLGGLELEKGSLRQRCGGDGGRPHERRIARGWVGWASHGGWSSRGWAVGVVVPARVAELERVGGRSLRRSPPVLWSGRCRPRAGWSSRGGDCVSEPGGSSPLARSFRYPVSFHSLGGEAWSLPFRTGSDGGQQLKAQGWPADAERASSTCHGVGQKKH